MKYSLYLTPAEAACFLTGLEEFGDINTAASVYHSITGDDQFDHCPIGQESLISDVICRDPDPEKLRQAIRDATEIEPVLETLLLDKLDERARLSKDSVRPKLSRHEIASYFEALGLSGDHYSKVAEGRVPPRGVFRRDEAAKNHPKKLSTKTRNSYLALIDALAKTLIKGSTGSAGKDAEAAIKAIELSLGDAPVTQKTLSKYLAEAREE